MPVAIAVVSHVFGVLPLSLVISAPQLAWSRPTGTGRDWHGTMNVMTLRKQERHAKRLAADQRVPPPPRSVPYGYYHSPSGTRAAILGDVHARGPAS
jgi:hypothetical protein